MLPITYSDHPSFANAEMGLRGVKLFAQSHNTGTWSSGDGDEHDLTSSHEPSPLHCVTSLGSLLAQEPCVRRPQSGQERGGRQEGKGFTLRPQEQDGNSELSP